MKKSQIYFTIIIIFLFFICAIYGIVLETNTSDGFVKQAIFTVCFGYSLIIVIGLSVRLVLRNKTFIYAFLRSCLFSFIAFIILFFLSTYKYDGIKEAINSFQIFVGDPLEILIINSALCMVTLIFYSLIHIVGKIDDYISKIRSNQPKS